MSLQLESHFTTTKKIALGLGIVVIAVIAIILIHHEDVENKNPLPSNVKNQISFSTVYLPVNSQIQVVQGSVGYEPSQKTLSYTLAYDDTNIIFTEQKAPGNSSDVSVAYYQSIGLSPVTEIQTNLGLAALINFYTTNSYVSAGQNAVLADGGTLVIAHPSKNISPADWKTLFNSLKLYQ